MAAAAINEIAEELKCPICFEELNRPKVLNCQHVFCCKCLKKWVEQKKLLECPVCKNTGSLRRGEKIEDLPEPLILTKLQETLTRFMKASLADTGDRTCDLCTRGKAAGYWCYNCSKNMCEQCEKTHSAKKVFKNHKVIQLSEHTVCSEHKGELKTLYCQDCVQTICNMCLDDKHENHNVADATDVVPVKANDFQIFKKAAEKIRQQIVQHESAVKTEDSNLLVKYRSAERELKDVRTNFIELMDETERELDQKLQAEISGKDLNSPLLELRSTDRRPGTKLWERKIDCLSGDTLFDEKTGDVWISATSETGCLWKYDVKGQLMSKVLKGTEVFYFSLDTKRGTFIGRFSQTSIASISKSGDVIKQVSIPGAGYLRGLAYLPDRDWYALCDTSKHCVWFVDAGRMKVVKQIGSQGSGDDQFNLPVYVCYHSGAGYPSPVIVVGDKVNHCVKVLDTQGQYIRKYGSRGSGDREINEPAGVCVDNKGRILVSDCGNSRVVRFYHSGDGEQWEVVVTPDQLGGFYPHGVCVTNRGHLAVTTVTRDKDKSSMMPSSHLSLFSYQ